MRPSSPSSLARLLALLVFEGEGDSIAARGLRYVEPKLQQLEERELKSGEKRRKISYSDRGPCSEYLMTRLERARSAEEVLGVVVQALVAAHFADEQAVPRSHRIGFGLPGSYGFYGYEGMSAHAKARAEIPELVEKLAEPVLPARMRSQLAQRESE